MVGAERRELGGIRVEGRSVGNVIGDNQVGTTPDGRTLPGSPQAFGVVIDNARGTTLARNTVAITRAMREQHGVAFLVDQGAVGLASTSQQSSSTTQSVRVTVTVGGNNRYANYVTWGDRRVARSGYRSCVDVPLPGVS